MTGRTRMIGALVAVTAVMVGLHAVLAATGPVDVPIPVLLVLGYGAVGLRHLVRLASPPPTTTPLIGEGTPATYGYPDRPFVRARHWQERLDAAERDGEYFDRVLLPELRQLVTDRLRAQRGIDLDVDPDRARDLLGPRVWALLTPSGPRRPPGVSQLTAVLDDLEAL